MAKLSYTAAQINTLLAAAGNAASSSELTAAVASLRTQIAQIATAGMVVTDPDGNLYGFSLVDNGSGYWQLVITEEDDEE